jgi:hypothetical protein
VAAAQIAFETPAAAARRAHTQVAFPDLPPPTPEIKELDTAAAATVLEAEAEFNEAFDKLVSGGQQRAPAPTQPDSAAAPR